VERKPQQEAAKAPLKEAFAQYGGAITHLVFLTAGVSITFYTAFVYAATWLQQVANVPGSTALGINTAAMTLLLIVNPLAGKASDRYGRRALLMAGAAGMALFAYPLMLLMKSGTPLNIFLGEGGLAVLLGIYGGGLPAAMAELAPWRLRCTVLSVGYNLGVTVLGGTTPLVAEWLLSRTGLAMAPALYLVAGAALAFVAAAKFPKAVPHPMTVEFSTLG